MTAPHPVLDKSESLRAIAERFKLSCPETAWLGWLVPHRFHCAHGHVFERTPKSLARAKGTVICPSCIGQERLEHLRKIAREAQVECLDDQWRGFAALYNFRCQLGHNWRRRPNGARNHIGCPVCTRRETFQRQMLPDGLARLQQFAQARGGECLSSRYEGVARRYRFRCAEGHEWLAVGSVILGLNSWCMKCAAKRIGEATRLVDGLERLQTWAQNRGGRCLSDVYVGMQARYRFLCEGGHEWEATGVHIRKGSWCPHCAVAARRGRYRLVDGLEQVKELARRKGGECLSTEYHGMKGRYGFRCQNGHEWQTRAVTIQNGAWCRECANESLRLGLDRAHQIASERGGQCLSQSYHNSRTKLHWLCHRGHTWEAGLSSVKKGHWCPTCAHQAQIKSRTSKAWKRYHTGTETVGHLSKQGLD